MAIEGTQTSSRRAILAGLLGGLAATAAGALGRAQPVRATHEGYVALSHSNDATGETSITRSGDGNGFSVYTYGAGTGSYGQSSSGIGVWGDCSTGSGVYGACNSGNGVHGFSQGNLASGVYGDNSSDGYGVAGRTGSASRAATLGDNTGSGPGVVGESATGTGVLGISHGAGAVGVTGDATASNGVGIRAKATGGGTALSVKGKARFSRSGRLTVPPGASSVTKSGVTLDSASFVLATLQAYRAGIAIAAVVPNAAAGSFTIHLTKAVTSTTRVAWFVVN
jgi:hypothetical protein